MPPRKSNVSTSSTLAGEDASPITPSVAPMPGGAEAKAENKGKEKESSKKDKDKDELAIEDLTMPRTMVQRLAKGVLPPNTQIQKDAVTALSKSATTFISYISSHAQNHVSASTRKTINPQDVFAALRDTEFDFMIPRLEAELAKYNEIQTGKRNEYRKKVRESANARKSEGGEGELAQDGGGKGKASEDRSAKRVKGEGGEVVEEDTMDDQDVDMDGQEEEEEEDEDEDDDEDEAEEEPEEEPEEEEEEDGGDETEEDPDAMDEDRLENKPAPGSVDGSDEDSD